MHAFYNQVHDFCQMMQEEVARQWDAMPGKEVSASTALAFSEKFLLCPTTESARSCIQQDFPGALSFVLALEGVNQRLQKGSLQLSTEWPKYQTRFYILSCTVREYIDSLQVGEHSLS